MTFSDSICLDAEILNYEDVFTMFTCSLSLSFKAKVKVKFVKCYHINKLYIISKFIEVCEESDTSDKGSSLR